MREDVLYLLRLWRDGRRPEDWRASLEDLRTKERVMFATLASLLDFLDEHTARKQEGEPPERM